MLLKVLDNGHWPKFRQLITRMGELVDPQQKKVFIYIQYVSKMSGLAPTPHWHRETYGRTVLISDSLDRTPGPVLLLGDTDTHCYTGDMRYFKGDGDEFKNVLDHEMHCNEHQLTIHKSPARELLVVNFGETLHRSPIPPLRIARRHNPGRLLISAASPQGYFEDLIIKNLKDKGGWKWVKKELKLQ